MNIFGATLLTFIFCMASIFLGAVSVSKFGILKRERTFLMSVTIILVVVLSIVIIGNLS